MTSSGVRDIETTDSRVKKAILDREEDLVQSFKVFDEASSLSSLAGGGTQASGQGTAEGNYMSRADDIWLGPHGNQPEPVTIENGVIDASNKTGADSALIVVSPEGGVADNLDWILTGSDVLLYQEELIQTFNADITFRPTFAQTITNIVGDGVTTTITVTVTDGSGLATDDTVQISNTTNFNSDLVAITKTGTDIFTYELTSIGSATAEFSGDVDRGNIQPRSNADYTLEPNTISKWIFDTTRQVWVWLYDSSL